MSNLIPALTLSDYTLLRRYCAYGVDSAKFNPVEKERLRKLQQHPAAAKYVEAYSKRMAEAKASKARRVFHLENELASIGDAAVDTIRRAVAGPLYQRDQATNDVIYGPMGPLIREPEPTTGQRQAAIRVLEMLGVDADKQQGSSPTINFTQVNAVSDYEVTYDEEHTTPISRVMSRERRRLVINVIEDSLADIINRSKKVVSKEVARSEKKKKP